MHATGRAKAHEVKLLAALLYIIVNTLDFSPVQQLVLAAGLVYFHKVLINNASCTEVHMTYF